MAGELNREQARARLAQVLLEVAERLENELARLVAALDTTGGTLDSTRENLRQVALLRGEVQAIAEEQAIPRVIEALRAEIPGVVQAAVSELPELGVFAPQIEADLVAAIANEEREVLRAIVDGVSSDAERTLRAAITGALDVRALQASFADVLDTTMGRAAVALDRAVREYSEASVRGMGRSANEALEGTDELVYEYVGPNDSRTRAYCDARVGRYLTQAQADALDPTERFNCRHTPAPLLLSDARAKGLLPFKG